MVDIATLKYKVVIVSKGKRFNITDYLRELGWEENARELAERVTLTIRNDETAQKFVSERMRLGCTAIVYAKHGSKSYKEVARGEMVTRSPTNQSSSHDMKCVFYDKLYNLQKSQDNFFFKSGIGTKSRIKKVLGKWNIPLGKYEGPNEKHGKKKYQNKYLSDILLNILHDAVKKGGKRCVIRMEKGKVAVVPRGSNKDIYVFRGNNTKVAARDVSVADLVTRVKVVGRSNKKGKNKVIATVNGLTKYGIRQRIYTRGSDESTKEAKKAANQILDDNGKVKKEVTVQVPDVPYIRKGDLVCMRVGAVDGYYYVKGIQHDASSFSMSMDLKFSRRGTKSKKKSGSTGSGKTEKKKNAQEENMVGDIVDFAGGKHYTSSDGSKGFAAKAGGAKITKKADGAKHPYHLIHTDKKSNVYGWVDEGTFS